MFTKYFNYLSFFLKSTNQHGVHSPFIYQFVTKGLYKKTKSLPVLNNDTRLDKLPKKERKIVAKILSFFNIDTIYYNTLEKEETITKELILVYLEHVKNWNTTYLNTKHIILIKGIHDATENNKSWKKIICQTENIVTVDLFYFGIIFFRPKQAKEHFIIRI